MFPHSKLQGEWAESLFVAECLRRGLICAKPFGDSAPYDFIVESRPREIVKAGPRRVPAALNTQPAKKPDAMGLNPFGDSAPYDFIVESPPNPPINCHPERKPSLDCHPDRGRKRGPRRAPAALNAQPSKKPRTAGCWMAEWKDPYRAQTPQPARRHSGSSTKKLKPPRRGACAATATDYCAPGTGYSLLRRVQVKSVSVSNPPQGIYHFAVMRSVAANKKPYRAGDFDLLAAYIIPCNLWYIIPAREVVGLKTISLCPGHCPSSSNETRETSNRLPNERTTFRKRKLEKYRDAWELLTGG